MKNLFALDSYRFDVPDELIATYPVTPRDYARLMIVDRSKGTIEAAHVYDLPDILSVDDALIFNDTKVLHASLSGQMEHGRQMKFMLTKRISADEWAILAKPARILKTGLKIRFAHGIEGTILGALEGGERIIRFSEELSFDDLKKIGTIPLPPYIKRRVDPVVDEERYQTVYGKNLGSVAAPTAGLHFTDSLFERLAKKRVSSHFVTLHVGTGTFLPIRTQDIREHSMHYEWYDVSPETAESLNHLPLSSRRIAVGTTSCRVIETVASTQGLLSPGQGSTNLFIYPGYQFRFITSLFTNFHTPESSLLMLVATFMGYDLMIEAYAKAKELHFRLFSYGDAMLIL